MEKTSAQAGTNAPLMMLAMELLALLQFGRVRDKTQCLEQGGEALWVAWHLPKIAT